MKTQSCDLHSDRCQNCNYFAVGFLSDSNDKEKESALTVIMSHYLFFCMINVLEYVN